MKENGSIEPKLRHEQPIDYINVRAPFDGDFGNALAINKDTKKENFYLGSGFGGSRSGWDGTRFCSQFVASIWTADFYVLESLK